MKTPKKSIIGSFIVWLSHSAFGQLLAAIIIGVIIVVVGILIAMLLKRASQIPPRREPDVDNIGWNQPGTPNDLTYAELPYQIKRDCMDTNHWPPIDIYAQGFMPPDPTNGVPSFEKVFLDNFCVHMSVTMNNGTNGGVNSLSGNQGGWTNVAYFADGNTNTVFSNAFATLQMKADFSGIDVQQTPWSKTNVKCMFFKSTH